MKITVIAVVYAASVEGLVVTPVCLRPVRHSGAPACRMQFGFFKKPDKKQEEPDDAPPPPSMPNPFAAFMMCAHRTARARARCG